MKRYRAVLRARKGFLLGGEKIRESQWYETESAAQCALEMFIRENARAGRKIDKGKVITTWTKKALGKKSINSHYSKPSMGKRIPSDSPTHK